MGEQIRLARLRRHLSSELVAERAGVSRQTVTAVEKGSASVALGAYAAVLHALGGLEQDLLLIAKDDELGRKLQDLDLPLRKRAPRPTKEMACSIGMGAKPSFSRVALTAAARSARESISVPSKSKKIAFMDYSLGGVAE